MTAANKGKFPRYGVLEGRDRLFTRFPRISRKSTYDQAYRRVFGTGRRVADILADIGLAHGQLLVGFHHLEAITGLCEEKVLVPVLLADHCLRLDQFEGQPAADVLVKEWSACAGHVLTRIDEILLPRTELEAPAGYARKALKTFSA